MSILTLFGNAVRTYRSRRAAAATERMIASLPAEMRKDIGWPGATRIRSGAIDRLGGLA